MFKIQYLFNNNIIKKYLNKMIKKFLLLLSFSIFFISCQKTIEEDFFKKKYDTNNVEIVTLVETDSAYSPHEYIDKLYKITHKNLTNENFDSLFNEFLKLRREFINPTYNNCIKKTYAIKIDNNAVQIHSLFYVQHRGNVCIHDKENIFRQFSDIDHNFYYFKTEKELYLNNNNLINDSCIYEK